MGLEETKVFDISYNGFLQFINRKRAFVLQQDFQEVALKNYHLLSCGAESSIAQCRMIW